MKKSLNKPLVSVLIPVYNGTEYLDEAIESVLNSSYKNLEIILVDDGSTDKSQAKCKDYERKYAHVKFYGFRNNKGLSRCLNFGIKKAKGKYIARLNQDDIMLPKRLEKQVNFLEKHSNYVVVGGAIELFTKDKLSYDLIHFPKTDKQIRKQWMILSPYSDPTVMYRKIAYLQTEGYSQYFWPADDVHMWYQLGKIGKMANLNSVLTRVRWHDKCGSIAIHKRQIKKTLAVHLWASEFIQKPTWKEKSFWLMQYLSGLIFPAQFNWSIYRLLRHLQEKALKFKKQAFTFRAIDLSLLKSAFSQAFS